MAAAVDHLLVLACGMLADNRGKDMCCGIWILFESCLDQFKSMGSVVDPSLDEERKI